MTERRTHAQQALYISIKNHMTACNPTRYSNHPLSQLTGPHSQRLPGEYAQCIPINPIHHHPINHYPIHRINAKAKLEKYAPPLKSEATIRKIYECQSGFRNLNEERLGQWLVLRHAQLGR